MGLNFNSNFKPTTTKPAGKQINGYDRIYIDHDTSSFRSSAGPRCEFLDDTVSESAVVDGEELPKKIQCVMLGLVRTRQMWPKRDDNPTKADAGKIASKGKQCISLDGEWGNPQANFPWHDYANQKGVPAKKTDRLDCSTCPFTKWSTDGKHSAQCQPHWYVPLMPIDSPTAKPVVLDLTQSGITVYKEFIRNEIRLSNYPFRFVVNLSVEPVQKGKITFTRPRFNKVGENPEGYYPIYTYWMRRIKKEFHDPANLPALGGKPTGKFSALTPKG
ncbi:hypothetical protein SEA_JUMBO_63 [Gordonia phage Jumbo]|uniref:Uncharacterized protein n=1 Tax=Gordonia phage Jumbo TaxID=1887650 RepID=A0A1B3B0Q6_9CAUD|nr:hypothetical protein BIZ69_gp063 [Gordonia phage Jumbo]AOE44571.1 hypothetical protein SEA_JUMBO_63 [Gordonia phage Jumbo]